MHNVLKYQCIKIFMQGPKYIESSKIFRGLATDWLGSARARIDIQQTGFMHKFLPNFLIFCAEILCPGFVQQNWVDLSSLYKLSISSALLSWELLLAFDLLYLIWGKWLPIENILPDSTEYTYCMLHDQLVFSLNFQSMHSSYLHYIIEACFEFLRSRCTYFDSSLNDKMST